MADIYVPPAEKGTDNSVVMPANYTHIQAIEFLTLKITAFKQLSAVLLDIDDFHMKVPGDRDSTSKKTLLDCLLDHVRESLRVQPSDSFRHGRDSLLVVFPQVSIAEVCQRTLEALVDFRSRWVDVEGHSPVQLTFTAAIAETPVHGDTASLVLRVLENTLYQAKADGKNRVALPESRKMILKSSYYTDAQLQRLGRLALRLGLSEAELLRLALDEFLRKNEE